MTPVEAVVDVFAKAAVGDWPAVAAHMADDLVIHEPASLPYGGEWHGADAMRDLFTGVMGYWDDPDITILRIVGDADWVVAILSFAMTSKLTGNRIVQRMTEVSRIAGGKIAEIHIHYFDTALVAREAGPRR